MPYTSTIFPRAVSSQAPKTKTNNHHNSQVGSLTGQLKASLNSLEFAVVPCVLLAMYLNSEN